MQIAVVLLSIACIVLAITQNAQGNIISKQQEQIEELHIMALGAVHINKINIDALDSYIRTKDVLLTMPPRVCADILRKEDIIDVCKNFGITTHTKD